MERGSDKLSRDPRFSGTSSILPQLIGFSGRVVVSFTFSLFFSFFVIDPFLLHGPRV